MRNIKRLLLLSMLALTVLGLVGCGQEKTTATKEETTQTEQVTKQQENLKEETKDKTTEPANDTSKNVLNVTPVSSTEAPSGCASCHIKVSADKDYTLASKLKAKPNHPKVDVKTVADCMKCHKDGPGTFKKLMHKVHYKNESGFIKNYKGGCVNCHKLTTTGELIVAGLEAPGTKIQELTVTQVDKAPKGCLDCHVKVDEKQDYTFATILKKNPKHPAINFDDFNKCYQCHTGPFALEKFLHPKHLTGKNYQNYGNSCLNCHSVKEDGSISVKGKIAQ